MEANMEIVQIVGIVFAAVVILVIAYLYRESAILEGKTEVSIGPLKFRLDGKAHKQAGVVETPIAKIEQAADEGGAQKEPDQTTGASPHKIE
jgi:hypothetical protein